MLVEAVGTDMMFLHTTLERVALYVGETRQIGPSDVEECVVRTKEEVVWDFVDAVGEKQLPKAMLILDGMLEHGQEPIAVTALVGRHFRQLWTVKSLLQQGCPPQNIDKEIGVHSFVAQKLVQRARRFSDDQLQAVHTAIYETDVELKSLRIAPRLQLEALLFTLCCA